MTSEAKEQKCWLVWGGEVDGRPGWIGSQMCCLLRDRGYKVVSALSSLENRTGVEQELEQYKPDYVVNAAGVTGRPNVDWCESNKEETVRVNVVGQLNLLDCCNLRNIPVVNFGTGCIFEYDDAHPMNSGVGFLETDAPNFFGSWYSLTKGFVDQILARSFKTALTLRVRMPLSDDLSPRNFITKILNYQKVVNIPNSMTVLTEYLPMAIDMAVGGLRGTYNFTNPGVVSHNEILDLYKKYIDPDFKYTNFTLEEQAQILKAGRSNNELDTTKLVTDVKRVCGYEPTHIQVAIVKLFERMKVNLGK